MVRPQKPHTKNGRKRVSGDHGAWSRFDLFRVRIRTAVPKKQFSKILPYPRTVSRDVPPSRDVACERKRTRTFTRELSRDTRSYRGFQLFLKGLRVDDNYGVHYQHVQYSAAYDYSIIVVRTLRDRNAVQRGARAPRSPVRARRGFRPESRD